MGIFSDRKTLRYEPGQPASPAATMCASSNGEVVDAAKNAKAPSEWRTTNPTLWILFFHAIAIAALVSILVWHETKGTSVTGSLLAFGIIYGRILLEYYPVALKKFFTSTLASTVTRNPPISMMPKIHLSPERPKANGRKERQ